MPYRRKFCAYERCVAFVVNCLKLIALRRMVSKQSKNVFTMRATTSQIMAFGDGPKKCPATSFEDLGIAINVCFSTVSSSLSHLFSIHRLASTQFVVKLPFSWANSVNKKATHRIQETLLILVHDVQHVLMPCVRSFLLHLMSHLKSDLTLMSFSNITTTTIQLHKFGYSLPPRTHKSPLHRRGRKSLKTLEN